jgi:competence protein ComEA
MRSDRKHRPARWPALLLALACLALATPALAEGVVNVNTATPAQLELLPGVGEARAKEIVAVRDRLGGFKKVDDLLEVKGIGDASLAKLRPHITLNGRTTLAAE